MWVFQPEYSALLVLFLLTSMFIFLISYIFSCKFGSRYIFLLLWIFNWSISFIIGISVFRAVVLGHTDVYFEWLQLNIPHFLPIVFGLLVDDTSVKMFCLILFISFCVQLFSFEYMRGEPRQLVFMCILHIFTFFMLLFVVSPNLLQAFTAWEGLGFVSFALINFWSARDEANKASFKAIIFNRVADIWFILTIILSIICFNTLDFCTLNALSCMNWSDPIYIFIPFFNYIQAGNVLSFCLFMAAIGKSAQLGYHVWLTAAMEGPSPVSALLHSATMVTAGVYLLLRCSDIFCYSNPSILTIIIVVGILTCFFCGWFAFISSDFKRVVAYSTCSHLGLMFCIIGFGFFEVSELHLHIHAFFKTTLFLSAGLVMASMLHLQNFRKISSFALFLPICHSLLSFSGISLLGVPFTLGSISKERFIMLGYTNSEYSFVLSLFFIASAIALMTALLYTLKIIINIAHQPGYNGERRFPFFLKAESRGLWFSQFLLCVLVIVFYYLLSMFFVRGLIMLNPWDWSNSFSMFYNIHIQTLPFTLKFFLVIAILVIYIIFTNILYSKMFRINLSAIYPFGSLNLWLSLRGVNVYINQLVTIFNNFEYYIGNLYYKIIHQFLSLSFKLFIVWERGFLEIVGPHGIVRSLRHVKAQFVSKLFTKNLFDYLWDIINGLVFIFLIFLMMLWGVDLFRQLIFVFFILFCILTDK